MGLFRFWWAAFSVQQAAVGVARIKFRSAEVHVTCLF